MLIIDDEKPAIQVAENVTPLRQSQAWRAAGAWSEASINDPLMRYLHDGQKQTPVVTRVLMSALIRLWIPKKVALTIDSGGTFIIAQPGIVDSEPKGRLDRIVSWLTEKITWALTGYAEQRKFSEKRGIRKEATGCRTLSHWRTVKDMIKIMVLVTESQSQGQHCDGILVISVTSLASQADVMGQTTLVQSSDLHKTEFYKAQGFKRVADVVLGDQNPRWHDAPVIIKIVSRPKSTCK